MEGNNSRKKYPWTAKRIAAMAAIVLLVLLYVVTLFAAIFDSPQTGRLFRFFLGMTIFLPLFIWVVIWCVGKLTGRKTIADAEILQSDPEEREKMEREIQDAASAPSAHRGSQP